MFRLQHTTHRLLSLRPLLRMDLHRSRSTAIHLLHMGAKTISYTHNLDIMPIVIKGTIISSHHHGIMERVRLAVTQMGAGTGTVQAGVGVGTTTVDTPATAVARQERAQRWENTISGGIMGGRIQQTSGSSMAINGVVSVDMENLAKEGDTDSRALAGVIVVPGHPILQLILKGWTFMAPNGKQDPIDPDQAGAGLSKERRPRPQPQDGAVDGAMDGAEDGMGGEVDGVNGAGVGNITPFTHHLQSLRSLLLDQVTHPSLLAFLQRLLQVKQIPRKRRNLPLHPRHTIPPTTQLRQSHLPLLLLVQHELHLPPR